DSRHMALIENNGVSLAAGPMVATGRELDFAVKGNGLIVLEDGEGEAYTRQGSMQVDAEGRL
ncbi:MAG: flagellar biosynthesis protein FlgF, partial [Pseudomonas stutzeri]|nr:flagellar biosynthesis protein FlgF [Stutzerimonas stutzeri]